MQNVCFRMTRKALVAILLVAACAFPALAQQITVTGVVYEPEGEPAIGASVVVEGQTTGVVTDFDGNYTIQAPSDGKLVFSYIGCETQTIAVDGRTSIDVHLTTSATALNEVVAIGYGQVKKSDATGSVAVVKPDDIEAGLATSANDLLVGASPGVVVTTDGGNPGGGASIRIRGGASLTASNDPLVVIDGVPMNGSYGSASPMTMISPDNIESMTILKDASATAIYGSRASNGVIIITTKKGQSGRPQINFSANFHVNTPGRRWNVLDAGQFLEKVQAVYPDAIGNPKLIGQANTNWQDEIFRTSFSQDYSLSVGGTAGFLPYRVSVSYTGNNGILKTSEMQRTTVGFNLTPKFFNGLLQIQASAKGSYIVDNKADQGAIYSAITFNPTLPVYTAYATSGNLGAPIYGGFTSLLNNDGNLETNGSLNPVALLMGVDNKEKIWTSTGNLQVDYALHFLPELHFNLNLGYDVMKGETNNYNLPNSPQSWKSNYNNGAGQHYYNYQLSRNTLLDFYANYKKEFEAIKSNLDVTAGYSWQRFDYHNRNRTRINSIGYTSVYDPATGSFTVNTDPESEANIGFAHGDTEEARNKINYDANQLNLVSFFGRLNYIFDDTYLLTFTLRDDATSRFSKHTRWGLFPALALGWKFSNLFKDDTNILNEGKLRLGWGKTGQQAVGRYNNYTPAYSISQNSAYYPSPNGGAWINPLYPNAFDENLKWETTTTWNVAVDLGFLNNRFNATLEWYLRDTDDLLAYVPVPAGMTTTNAMTRNIGSLRNVGLDFSFTGRPVVTNDFTWTTGFNVAWNRNKITALTGSGEEDKNFTLGAEGNPSSANAGDIQVHKVGYPANSFYTLQQVYADNGDPIPNVYVDQNEDGVIDDNDLVLNHSRDPKVTMSWTNTINYKNWDFGITLRANLGNYVFNSMRARATNLYNLQGQGNEMKNVIDSDFYFNDGTAVSNLIRSSYFVENASFLRCDNISVGYTFDSLLKDALRLRLFGAVQNPFVITKYKGLDPEVFSGVDNNAYPRPVTFTIGLVANF